MRSLRCASRLLRPARLPRRGLATCNVLLAELAARRTTPLSLRTMYEIGREGDKMAAARFLHSELPVRMAQRIDELRHMPLGLSSHEAVQRVISYYEDAVVELVASEAPRTEATEAAFARLVGTLLQDNTTVPDSLGRAVQEQTVASGNFGDDMLHPTKSTGARARLDGALNRFFTARVGLRLLVEHYLVLRQPPSATAGPDDSGIIQARCRPFAVAQDAAIEVQGLFRLRHGREPPEILIVGDETAEITYVTRHMRFCITELLKNATRAVGERHAKTSKPAPPIKLVIALGTEDLTIKVEDLGGGCARSARHLMWSWFWSSNCDPSGADMLSGRGIGLPLTRILARYFGGELSLRPMEDYGCDAYLHLNRLGNKCENLPSIVRASPAESDSTLPASYLHFDEAPHAAADAARAKRTY